MTESSAPSDSKPLPELDTLEGFVSRVLTLAARMHDLCSSVALKVHIGATEEVRREWEALDVEYRAINVAGAAAVAASSTLPATCRDCGCTEEKPCPAGCGWALPGLCSRCAAVQLPCPRCGARAGLGCKPLHDEPEDLTQHEERHDLVRAGATMQWVGSVFEQLDGLEPQQREEAHATLTVYLMAELVRQGRAPAKLFPELQAKALIAVKHLESMHELGRSG